MHTQKQWTAAAWMLERRWPERYAKRPETEITVTQQTAVMTGPPEPPTGALMDYVEKLAEVARSLKLPGGKAEVKVEIDQDQNGHGHSNGSNGTSNGAQ